MNLLSTPLDCDPKMVITETGPRKEVELAMVYLIASYLNTKDFLVLAKTSKRNYLAFISATRQINRRYQRLFAYLNHTQQEAHYHTTVLYCHAFAPTLDHLQYLLGKTGVAVTKYGCYQDLDNLIGVMCTLENYVAALSHFFVKKCHLSYQQENASTVYLHLSNQLFNVLYSIRQFYSRHIHEAYDKALKLIQTYAGNMPHIEELTPSRAEQLAAYMGRITLGKASTAPLSLPQSANNFFQEAETTHRHTNWLDLTNT